VNNRWTAIGCGYRTACGAVIHPKTERAILKRYTDSEEALAPLE
jgi:hypothetical protein